MLVLACSAHAGEELDDIETKLDTVFQGTRFQSVTKEGKKTLMEKSDLIPQVLAGFARRARKKVVEQAASPSHVDISSGQHLPVRMAKVRARTPALTPLKHAHATLKHSTVVDVVQGDHPLLDSSASPPRHSPIASLTLTGPASSQQRAKVGDDAVSDGDASDMGSPKGLTREDMRVTGMRTIVCLYLSFSRLADAGTVLVDVQVLV